MHSYRAGVSALLNFLLALVGGASEAAQQALPLRQSVTSCSRVVYFDVRRWREACDGTKRHNLRYTVVVVTGYNEVSGHPARSSCGSVGVSRVDDLYIEYIRVISTFITCTTNE